MLESKTPDPTDKEILWHAQTAEETSRTLTADPHNGLSSQEASRRLQQYGRNALTPKKGTSSWIRFALQFHQPLVYILLAAAAVTFLLKEKVDSAVIFGVVLVNAVIGFLQESKALHALNALARSMTTSAVVLRDGRSHSVPSSDVVPGDVILLSSGDKVPADLRLFQVRELQVNESSLTGESVPVQKKCGEFPAETVLADRSNMAYAATFVTYGQGRGMVTATGDRTEVGRISQLLSSAESLETPLTRKISEFSGFLLKIILGMAALTFFVGVYRGQSAIEMFMAAVALSVSAIPEGLPAAVTITLAIGVTRMARRRAIVRKLPAVETLGSTGTICTDKTGTLTENQMTVREIFAGGRSFTVSGAGYAPDGLIHAGDVAVVNVLSDGALSECLRAGLLCNDAHLLEKEWRWQTEGDPTEGALIVSAAKGGLRHEAVWEQMPRLDVIPFESEYQYMATLHALPGGGKKIIYVKGAVEKILDRCSGQLDGNGDVIPLNHQAALDWTTRRAADGLRVLAFACVHKNRDFTDLCHTDLQGGLTFLGLQAMMDPPREEAVRAVANCHRAGIKVKMITGDHVLTASSIARQIGLHQDTGTELLALTGNQMETLSEEAFKAAAMKAQVFARVTPEQKLRLVKALQSTGEVVAMTGDGVNDAPALKQADIGVAMGRGGTEVAKEAADMVLTDDNFASIEEAVREGRGVFDNLRKFIIWTIPTNLGEGLAIVAAVFTGSPLPVLPVHILWINMTTAVCLGLMLAFEPQEPDVMDRPPRDPRAPIMTAEIIRRTFLVGIMLVTGVFGLFHLELWAGGTLEQARTTATAVLVIGELFYLFNCRSLTKSIFSIGFFTNRWLLWGCALMMLLQGLFTYAPFMNAFFESAPLPLRSWFFIAGTGALISAVVAVEKKRAGKKE